MGQSVVLKGSIAWCRLKCSIHPCRGPKPACTGKTWLCLQGLQQEERAEGRPASQDAAAGGLGTQPSAEAAARVPDLRERLIAARKAKEAAAAAALAPSGGSLRSVVSLPPDEQGTAGCCPAFSQDAPLLTLNLVLTSAL